MRTVTDEERKTATLIPLDSILSEENDTEKAFEDFRAGFSEGDEPGTVRAFELQIDERGNIGTTRTQTRLGAWPIDAHKFDELCSMLIEQFMTPDQTRMAVRLVGTRPAQTGYAFNKIVLLKRPQVKRETSGSTQESTASIMKIMQENNERMFAMIQRLQAPAAEKPDTMGEIQKMMAFAQAMNAPMMGMLQSILPALAGRPVPAAGADPFASVGSLLDVAERLSDMRGGGGGGDDNSFAGILRAISPLAKPALEALPAIAAMQAASRPAPVLLPRQPAPTPAAPRPAPAATGSGPAAPIPNTGGGGAAPAPQTQLTDLPSGDAAMLAQLKPQIDSLVTMAEQGSDATGAADLIFDQVFLNPQLPDEIFEQLASFVDSEKFVQYVTIMNPAAKPHVNWFTAFKAQIVSRLTAQDAEVEGMPAANPLAKLQ